MSIIKDLRHDMGLSQQQFGDYFNIPLRTIQRWEYEKSKPSEYVIQLIQKNIQLEKEVTILKNQNKELVKSLEDIRENINLIENPTEN